MYRRKKTALRRFEWPLRPIVMFRVAVLPDLGGDLPELCSFFRSVNDHRVFIVGIFPLSRDQPPRGLDRKHMLFCIVINKYYPRKKK